VVDLFQILADAPMKELLAGADGEFEFRGAVSDLVWLGVFFGDRYRTRVGGVAVLEGVARLADGMPAPGTAATVRSEALVFNFLDYASRGRGEIRLAVADGGDHDDWQIELELDEADLRRRSDRASFVENVRIEAEARIEGVGLDGDTPDFELAFKMPYARVTDVAVFNRYLPPDAPLALTGGAARLASQLRLLPDDAQGWVRLDAEGVDLAIDEQEVRGDLRAEIAVNGGRPAEMVFDLGGSRLRLENVGVNGADAVFDDDGAHARGHGVRRAGSLEFRGRTRGQRLAPAGHPVPQPGRLAPRVHRPGIDGREHHRQRARRDGRSAPAHPLRLGRR